MGDGKAEWKAVRMSTSNCCSKASSELNSLLDRGSENATWRCRLPGGSSRPRGPRGSRCAQNPRCSGLTRTVPETWEFLTRHAVRSRLGPRSYSYALKAGGSARSSRGQRVISFDIECPWAQTIFLLLSSPSSVTTTWRYFAD